MAEYLKEWRKEPEKWIALNVRVPERDVWPKIIIFRKRRENKIREIIKNITGLKLAKKGWSLKFGVNLLRSFGVETRGLEPLAETSNFWLLFFWI